MKRPDLLKTLAVQIRSNLISYVNIFLFFTDVPGQVWWERHVEEAAGGDEEEDWDVGRWSREEERRGEENDADEGEQDENGRTNQR